MYTEIAANKRATALFLGAFLIFIIFLGWVFSHAFGSPLILYLAVFIAFFQAFISYYYSDKITLAVSGAREVKREENLQLHRLVENLAIAAGLPKPKVYVIEDSAPNAFATGRDPKHAAVAVTTGLLDKLDKPELEGVIAHELSHIGNYDIRLMSIIVVLVGVVVLLSDLFLRWSFWGVGDRDERDNSNAIFFVLALIFAILAPLVATIIKLAISRRREFLADASGALLTRYPEGLASALEKIAADQEPLEAANKATAHLYIANPLKEHAGTARGWFASLFDTHPPIQERIRRLRSMLV